MGTMTQSWPPQVAKPGLAKCDPARAQADADVTRWFARWCRDNGVSVRDLQAILGLRPIAPAHAKHSGRTALTLVDIRRFPSRFRHELTSRFLMWCDEADRNLSAHR